MVVRIGGLFAKRLAILKVGEQSGPAYARLIFRVGAYLGKRGFEIGLSFRGEVRRGGKATILGGFELIAKLVHGRDIGAELIAILGCNGEAACALHTQDVGCGSEIAVHFAAEQRRGRLAAAGVGNLREK